MNADDQVHSIDLDDVGKDSYHHTSYAHRTKCRSWLTHALTLYGSFEMLGNWSFGDYFKAGILFHEHQTSDLLRITFLF